MTRRQNTRRALILRSSMRHYCAGAELSWFTDYTIQADREAWNEFMYHLEDLPIPTVAAVNGGALGAFVAFSLPNSGKTIEFTRDQLKRRFQPVREHC